MKRKGKGNNSLLAAYLSFALALVLILTGTIGAIMGKNLMKLSRPYEAQIETDPLVKLTIVENDKSTEGELLTAFSEKDAEELHLGQEYKEVLTVRNDGIDAYMRVTVYKFWMDEDGNRDTTLDPSLIELKLENGGNWVVDTDASTAERTVLYYKGVFGSGAESAAFSSTLSISPKAGKLVEETIDGTVVTWEYVYGGKRACIEVVADGVQTHNAKSAILSCWGVDGEALGIIG